MNVLVVAPHADDEVLGCGGVLAKYSSMGANTYVAIMTNANVGAPLLFSESKIQEIRAEAIEAHAVLKVKETFFFEFPAPRLETYPAFEISNKISDLIRRLDIDTLYIPHAGDMHKDHEVIHYASLVAARPVNNCPVRNIYTYETLSETDWAPPFGSTVFIPNVFVDISDHYNDKEQAMSCFGSQLKPFPNARSLEALESLAKLRGATVGFQRAEAFALIRSARSGTESIYSGIPM